jgi:hypothetical protein
VSELLELPHETDPLYPESGAYHEAGHAVVAAVLGLRLSLRGIHLSPDGNGVTYYEFRNPRRFSNAHSHVGREHTIIATLAGVIAQKKFHPRCSTAGANDDRNIVDMLVQEVEEEYDFAEAALLQAQWAEELPKEAKRLVDLHWPAIDALARELWNSDPIAPDHLWSTSPKEKRLGGARIAEILKPCGIEVTIWDESPVPGVP